MNAVEFGEIERHDLKTGCEILFSWAVTRIEGHLQSVKNQFSARYPTVETQFQRFLRCRVSGRVRR